MAKRISLDQTNLWTKELSARRALAGRLFTVPQNGSSGAKRSVVSNPSAVGRKQPWIVGWFAMGPPKKEKMITEKEPDNLTLISMEAV